MWSLDFITDATQTGTKLRILTVGDDFTRVSGGRSGNGFSGNSCCTRSGRVAGKPGRANVCASDNGPEFIETGLNAWLTQHAMQSAYTKPGHPWQNGVRESFHSRLRDELLDGSVLENVADAQRQIEA